MGQQHGLSLNLVSCNTVKIVCGRQIPALLFMERLHQFDFVKWCRKTDRRVSALDPFDTVLLEDALLHRIFLLVQTNSSGLDQHCSSHLLGCCVTGAEIGV
ncbi:hypothetical protein NQZ68_008030 [Dissostichus eleginoides]|nr:hypothetical protein NQZ68_008030 [Dissostichus eleginoides]